MSELLVDTVGRIRYLTINRPEKRNAVTMAQLDSLFDTLVESDRDPDVGCIVLRGAGDSFCAGIDIDPSQMDMEYDSRSMRHELRLLEPVRSMASPPTHMWTYLAGPQWSKRLLLTGDSIDGKTAERAGLVLESMPVDQLADATSELAGKIARVPPDVLAHNRSICNKAVEAMGRHLIQELAREQNAMAHKSPDAQEFGRIAAASGLKAALAWQAERFR